jgi:hypothetical protein
MLFFHRRKSLFPYLVIFLSLVLVLFMFYAFSFQKNRVIQTDDAVIAVTTEDYKKEVKPVLDSFDQKISLAKDPLAQLVAVEESLNELLALRVPTEYQSVHLNLALALNAMKETLRTGDRNIDAALLQWQTAEQMLEE